MSERILQAVLIRRALTELQHQIALPNDTSFYIWEADLITVNKSGYVNEIECKISRADFLRDRKKRKFQIFEDHPSSLKRHEAAMLKSGLNLPFVPRIPNYFWYATLDFDIEVPDFAGWLKVSYIEKRKLYQVEVKKPAPILHKIKPHERKIKMASRLLSFKLMNFYDPYANPSQKD